MFRSLLRLAAHPLVRDAVLDERIADRHEPDAAVERDEVRLCPELDRLPGPVLFAAAHRSLDHASAELLPSSLGATITRPIRGVDISGLASPRAGNPCSGTTPGARIRAYAATAP